MQQNNFSTACVDWKETIVAKQSLIPFSDSYLTLAKEDLQVFNSLIVVDALGSPRLVDISKPWVQDFAAAIFGFYDKKSGKRLIKEVMLLIRACHQMLG